MEQLAGKAVFCSLNANEHYDCFLIFLLKTYLYAFLICLVKPLMSIL